MRNLRPTSPTSAHVSRNIGPTQPNSKDIRREWGILHRRRLPLAASGQTQAEHGAGSNGLLTTLGRATTMVNEPGSIWPMHARKPLIAQIVPLRPCAVAIVALNIVCL